jgi:hypothetical protein
MALLGMEGWDSIAIGDTTDYWQGYDTTNSTLVAGAGRCGTTAFRNIAAVGNGPFIGVTTVVSSGYAGWAYSPEDFSPGNATFSVENASAGSPLAFIIVQANGSIDVWKGPNTTLGTFIGSTDPGFISIGHYSHIGFEWNFDAAAGYFRVYIDGVLRYDSGAIDSTNIWTSGQWDLLYWHPKGYMDDLYWGDTSGAAPWNAFLGDCHVEENVVQTDAVGGNGFYRDFTPSAGTDHGALIDEIPPDDGTTYLEADTVSFRESHGCGSIVPGSGTIYGVQVMPNMVKTDAGTRAAACLIRSGGSTATGDIQALAQTNYKYYPDVFQTNPVTGLAWTVSQVNAQEIGVEVSV